MVSADEVVSRVPVIPVITLNRMQDAMPLAGALVNGGLTVLEVTLRTGVALPAEALQGVGDVRRMRIAGE